MAEGKETGDMTSSHLEKIPYTCGFNFIIRNRVSSAILVHQFQFFICLIFRLCKFVVGFSDPCNVPCSYFIFNLHFLCVAAKQSATVTPAFLRHQRGPSHKFISVVWKKGGNSPPPHLPSK